MVIYRGGLYLFSISLLLGSGSPPALPWPTGQSVGGTLRQNPAPQTRSPSPAHRVQCMLCLTLDMQTQCGDILILISRGTRDQVPFGGADMFSLFGYYVFQQGPCNTFNSKRR